MKQLRPLYQVLIALLIFLIPSNLFYVVSEVGSRVHGLRIDYLLPKFHASDGIIFALLILFAIEDSVAWYTRSQSWWHRAVSYVQSVLVPKKTPVTLLVLTVLLALGIGVRQLSAGNTIIAFWEVISWIKIALLAYVLWQKRELLRSSVTYLVLASTLLFQSLVGIMQYLTQQSVASYLFLGETDLSNFAGLAKTTLGGIERVLPYGTTAHPNVLAGFLSLSLLLLIPFYRKQSREGLKISLLLTFIVASVALFLTQSISAWLTFALGLSILFGRKYIKKIPQGMLVGILAGIIVVSTWLPFSGSSPSLVRRKYLNTAGIKMFLDRPLLGVGLKNFTPHVESYADTREVVRFVQPAHNVLVLWLAETGLLGFALLVCGFLLWKRTQPEWILLFLVLSPIAFLDHYLLTLQSGILLSLFFLLSYQSY